MDVPRWYSRHGSGQGWYNQNGGEMFNFPLRGKLSCALPNDRCEIFDIKTRIKSTICIVCVSVWWCRFLFVKYEHIKVMVSVYEWDWKNISGTNMMLCILWEIIEYSYHLPRPLNNNRPAISINLLCLHSLQRLFKLWHYISNYKHWHLKSLNTIKTKRTAFLNIAKYKMQLHCQY